MAKNLFAARFRWLSALPMLIVIGAMIVIAVGALSGDRYGAAPGREKFFDYYQHLKPDSLAGASPFHLIRIDRDSLNRIGPWPWPRTILADLVDAAASAGARGVVIVEPVDAPDPLSPTTIGEFWLSGARDEGLARQLALLPRTDETLAGALARLPGSVAIAGDVAETGGALQRADVRSADWLGVANGTSEFLALPAARERFAVNAEIAAVAGRAVAALEPDADGVVRRIPLLWSSAGRATPSVALDAARLALGGAEVAALLDTASVSAAGMTPGALRIGPRAAPLGPATTMRLYFPRQSATPATSAWRVLDGTSSNSELSGKVVLIGLDGALGGTVSTARGAMSAPDVHAAAARQILSGAFPVRPGWAGYVEAIAVMLLGAAAIMWSQRLEFWKAVGVAALVSLALISASVLSFLFGNLLINPLPPSLALFLGALSVAGGRSLGVVLRDDSVRGSFQGALPEPTMKRLREEGAAEILDGGYRPLTVLACELRLTDEDMQKLAPMPDEVTRLMASACIDLRKAVIDTGGAAEQAEGGKVFAYFNAPLENADHIEAGCASALRLIESMDKINADLDASPRLRGVQLHLAIGVATGECFVGPMGHGRANRYSAIGPAVDMAAFLRRQAEFYGPAIICDEAVYRKSHHHYAFLELDRLKTNRADKPVSIYALVGNPFIKSSKSYRTLDENHRQLLAAYRAGDWAAARAMLMKAKESPGAKIALFDIYEERIRKMADEGVPPDWDGAHPVVI